jgi:hypothetical protein
MKMNNLIAAVIFFLLMISTASLNALPASWSYTVTFNTHVILVQQSVPITINASQIASGDYIGVFYPNLSGGLSCGGYMEYTGSLGSLSAWPEDIGGDGFAVGQDFIWKIWDASSNTEYIAYATYDQSGAFPSSGQFVQNGMSSLTSLQAVTASVPWSYTITSANHTVLVPQDLTVLMDDDFEIGDCIGAFYYDSLTLVCGGYCVWYGTTTNVTVWGDDAQTTIKDGFLPGDEFIWKIWDASEDMQYFASASYMTGMISQETFQVNGMSGLDTLIVDIPWSYTITSTNHTILLQSTGDYTINGMPLGFGDLIGVFYDSLGTLKCGGFTTWEGTTSNVSAWGEDIGNDGFIVGDEFVWKVYDMSEGIEYFATPTYLGFPMPNQELFAVNGMSGLESLHAQTNIVPWDFTITSTNHQILLPDFAAYLMDGDTIEIGDYIGVFYDSLGTLVCGGYRIWEGLSTSLPAWGAEQGQFNGFADGEAFKWKIWDASEDTVYDVQPTYMQPPAMPNTGFYEANGMSGILSLESILIEVPWSFTITSGNHSILLPVNSDFTIDTSAIEPGDYVGVFFDSLGTLICAGYTEWTGTTTAVTAWGADAGLDGFDIGEMFKWKIWDASEDTVYDAFATYDPVMPDQEFYATNGMSALLTLGTTVPYSVQQITLNLGWGMYSTFINPFEPNVDSVFADIVNNVQIIKDGNGAIFWPQYGINLIGNLVVGNGYQIKMFVADMLELVGNAVVPEQTSINLSATWGIYGYLRQTPAPIDVMLSTVVAGIEIVKNGVGDIYWPLYGINMIGNMMPGDGYQIKILSPQTLIYPPNTAAYSKSFAAPLNLAHYGQAINTGSNMSLAIPYEAWPANFKPIPNGELGIYSAGGLLVGSGRFIDQNIALSVWGNDEFTQKTDGLLLGENFEIRYWSPESEEISLQVTNWEKGDASFAKDKISVVGKFEIIYDFELGQNYPNPFSSHSEVEIYVTETISAELKIYSELGRLEMRIPLKNLKPGVNRILIPADKLSSGQYFYRLESEEFTATKRMQIIK